MSRLDCGHVCTRLCHPNDSEHKKYVCRKETEKECPHGHKTKLKCFQKLVCKVLVEKVGVVSVGTLSSRINFSVLH